MNEKYIIGIIGLIVLFIIYEKLSQIARTTNRDEELLKLHTKNIKLVSKIKDIDKVVRNGELRAVDFKKEIKKVQEEINKLEDSVSELELKWLIITNPKIITMTNEELNQDMSEFSDDDLDNILEEDTDDSSSSSSSSSNTKIMSPSKKNYTPRM